MHAWRLRRLGDRLQAASDVRPVVETEAESLALDLAALAEAALIELAARGDGEWIAADPDCELDLGFPGQPGLEIGDR